MKKATLYITALIAGWFLFLCLLHYFSKRPLWLDERLLFENIRDFSVAQLFGPLKNTQVFPRAYLALIKLISQPFSYNALALRLLPLVFMLAGFFVWLKIYRLSAKAALFLVILLFSFASSHFTTYYAAEFKQYSCDLFATGVFVLFIIYQGKFADGDNLLRKLWFFSIISPFLLFFSYISALLMWIVAYNYFLLLRKGRKLAAPFIAYSAIAVACCILLYFFDIRFSLGNQSMHDYWKDYFISTQSTYEFMKSLTEGIRNITVRWYLEKKWAMGIATVFMPFCWVAIVKYCISSFRKHKGALVDLDALCAILLSEVFLLGILQMYPFTGCRATLFIAPFIFYMIVKGIYLFERIKFVFYPLIGAYIILLSAVSWNLAIEYLKLYV